MQTYIKAVVDHDKAKAMLLDFIYEQPGFIARWTELRDLMTYHYPLVLHIRGLVLWDLLKELVDARRLKRVILWTVEDRYRLTTNQWLIMTRSRMLSSSSCTSSRTLAATGRTSTGC